MKYKEHFCFEQLFNITEAREVYFNIKTEIGVYISVNSPNLRQPANLRQRQARFARFARFARSATEGLIGIAGLSSLQAGCLKLGELTVLVRGTNKTFLYSSFPTQL